MTLEGAAGSPSLTGNGFLERMYCRAPRASTATLLGSCTTRLIIILDN